jgi:hypothetical protein
LILALSVDQWEIQSVD